MRKCDYAKWLDVEAPLDMSQLGSIQRKTRSILADLKRARSAWAELNSDGLAVANALVNARLQERYVDHPNHWHPSLDDLRDLRERYERKMARRVADLAGKLAAMVDKMASQHTKMTQLTSQFVALADRARSTLGADFVDSRPLFLTVPLARFVSDAQSIHAMYTAELNTKRSLAAGLATIGEHAEAMVMLSAWINQPGLDDERMEAFEEVCMVEIGEE